VRGSAFTKRVLAGVPSFATRCEAKMANELVDDGLFGALWGPFDGVR
jgi:hypothetical protein